MILLFLAALFGIAVVVEIAAIIASDWAAIICFGIIIAGLWHFYWMFYEQAMEDEREAARRAYYHEEEEDAEDDEDS